MDELLREAATLHRAAFDREVPEEVARRYAAAHRALSRITDAERAWMKRALDEDLDLEALEAAARRDRPDHVLCRKFKALLYVAEASPEYYADFVSDEPRRFQAFLSLMGHGVRTLFKRLKGRALLRRLETP